MAELTLEQMASKIDKIDTAMNKFIANTDPEKEKKEAKKAMEEEKEKEAKKAMEEEDKKKEAKSAALKKAMEEKDEDKRDAAIRKAMDMKDETKKEASDDEKEEKEHVASIIKDKKSEIDTKILQASNMVNPTGVNVLLKQLESQSFTASKKMLEDMETIYGKQFIAGVPNSESQTSETPNIPYFMASTSQSNSDDLMSKSTAELMEMQQ